jgi:hypothetical protein
VPDEARLVYLLLVLVLIAPAGIAALRRLLRKRDK